MKQYRYSNEDIVKIVRIYKGFPESEYICYIQYEGASFTFVHDPVEWALGHPPGSLEALIDPK